jgi:hypothetical protein
MRLHQRFARGGARISLNTQKAGIQTPRARPFHISQAEKMAADMRR